MSAAPTAAEAARHAVREALARSGEARPKLAVVFASTSYPDVADVPRVVREVAGDVLVVGGGSGGCVFGAEGTSARGVSVVLVGGDDIEVASQIARLESPTLVETVPAAEEVSRAADAAARRGFMHYACLLFAPGVLVDGDALVAAVRKGAGERALLAGALTGDDLEMDRPTVFASGELRDDCAVVTGIFSKRSIGIAARHGFSPVGPRRTVTRADGIYLVELDGRPALDVWIEDARAAGADPPAERKALALYLMNHFGIGIAEESTPRIAIADAGRELVVRAMVSIRDDGAVQLSAPVGDGMRVRVAHATREDLLRATTDAADAAAAAIDDGSKIAGALVLACSSRLAVIGDVFAEEHTRLRARLDAPVGGACVYGEVARNVRDADAFYNMTAVVMAFGR